MTKNNTGTLIHLVNSKDKCNCFVNPLSSYTPTDDNAELGGYEPPQTNAYKEKKKVKLDFYACPKANKVEADKLVKWSQQKN